jgi:phosphoglycolate phosphatase
MSQPRLFIFDFDGTLADSYPWFAAELSVLARRWRFRSVSDEEHEPLRLLSASAIMDHLGVPAWKRPMLAADMRWRMSRDIASIGLFDGVGSMLHALATAGLRIGIVSSNAQRNVDAVLGADLRALIDHCSCGAAISSKHGRLRRLQRRAGLAASEVIYIGDEIRDIVAARRAGIAAGAVTWGYNRAAALRRYGPDLVFDEVAEIAARLIDSEPGD